MTRSWTLSVSFFSLLLLAGLFAGLDSRAQIITNRSVLQRSSQTRASQDAALHRMVLSLARQKGWPLTMHNKKGAVAYLRGVSSTGLPVYITTTDNIISAATIRTNQLWAGGSTGLNLSGSSIAAGKIAVWDEGEVRPTHVELTGRVTQKDNALNLSDHSTHVAGTMIAAGVNPLAKGMSYGAQKLFAYDFTDDITEMMGAASDLLISNHSYATIAGWYFNADQNRWEFYGEPGDTVDIRFSQYDAETKVWDSIAYNAPDYLIVKAAGNNRGETGPAIGDTYYRMDANGNFFNAGARKSGTGAISSNNGYNSIPTYGTAKNILTVGAVGPIPGGYSQPSDVVMTDFSSWGPSGDGRIKPDVVADGLDVLSSVSSADNAYDILSGTSMASPAAAGSSFLLQEEYAKLHSGTFMRAATLKGLLIHTADEAGPSAGPDYQFGWGLINMQKAVAVITSNNTDQLLQENLLTQGSHDADNISVVASGKSVLTATISWTDPPGNVATPTGANFADISPKLINDLDIKITDNTTNKVYSPWVLDPNNRPAAATTGNNKLDNVEKIEVDSLIPGRTYTITVNHKSTLARGSQAYSLLVSGVGGAAYCTSASAGGSGTRIDNVSFAGINNSNTPGCKTYSDFTATPAAQLPLGGSLPIAITYRSCGAATTTNIAVYIDFNNNGVFTDAGDLALQNPNLLASGTGAAIFSGNITVPTTATVGSYSRMRIVAQDNGALATPPPCGAYTGGETQDYRVLFTAPSNDVGVTALEYPTFTTCANDSQLVAIHIRNFGTTPQNNVPVTTVIKNGAAVIATLQAICKDSIAPKSEVIFTYNQSFPSIAGLTYTFTSTTGLATDLNTANNQNVSAITVNAGAAAVSGTATICGVTSAQVVLKAAIKGNDLPLWYDSPTATTPIAAGVNTTSSEITSNKTYYVGVSDLKAKAGPPNKLAYSNGAGAYFKFGGNFVKFTTGVPLTIESSKLYVGHSGKVSLTLATLVSSVCESNGIQYSYIPLYNTVIDVYATKQVPQSGQQIDVPAGDNSDTGAVYLLNIPVPTPGDYIILIDCSDSANLFLNLNIKSNPYPVSLPGIFSITGNDFRCNLSKLSDSVTYFQQFYYPFYNIGVRLAGCPGPRTAVTATTKDAPVIILNGNILTSSADTGNQWYLNGAPLVSSDGQKDTAKLPGSYYTVISDPVTGCILTSNKISFSPSGVDANASIGLTTSPNPSNGVFQLQFFMSTPDNTSVTLINTLGQKVYEASYPNFSGQFSRQIEGGDLGSGMYVLKIMHGSSTYIKKIMIKR
jgi:hypothetical protein